MLESPATQEYKWNEGGYRHPSRRWWPPRVKWMYRINFTTAWGLLEDANLQTNATFVSYGCSYYISHGHSWYNYIHLETLEKRCGQHSWKFAWVEATNSHLKHSPAIQNSQRLAQENCVTNCITFRVLGIRKERHQFLPFTSIALENLAILMGQVLPLAGAGHVDCLKPVSTALKSLFEGWLEES